MSFDKAFAVAEACKASLFSSGVMRRQLALISQRHDLDDEEFTALLIDYTTTLGAAICANVTTAVMSEADLSSLLDAIDDLESLDAD